MNILSISTASKSTLITIEINGQLHSRMLEFSKHSENLFPLLIDMLDEFDLTLADFDCFGCVVGPGSFTGIRIGLSVIKGFAFALEKPIIAVNSLELLAYNALLEENDIITSVINAGAGLVYHQTFKKCGEILYPVTQAKLDKFTHFLGFFDTEFGVNSKVIYSQNNEKGEDYSSTLGESQELNIDSLAKAIKAHADLEDFTDAVRVTPLYLRVSQAEQNVNNLNLTKLNAVDLPSLLDLEDQKDDADLEWSSSALIESLKSPDYVCFGISNRMSMLGMIIAKVIEGEGEIVRLKVAKSARTLGIGTRLLKELCQYLKNQGCTKVLLEVNEHNFPAISLYEKFGFVSVGRRKNYYKNSADAILYDYDLSK